MRHNKPEDLHASYKPAESSRSLTRLNRFFDSCSVFLFDLSARSLTIILRPKQPSSSLVRLTHGQ